MLLLFVQAIGQKQNKEIFDFEKKKVYNLNILNSEFDDYNLIIDWEPDPVLKKKLLFSSNRKSKGRDFDIVSFDFKMKYKGLNRIRIVTKEIIDYELLESVNTQNDELGPCLVSSSKDRSSECLIFTRDSLGISQLYITKRAENKKSSAFKTSKLEFEHNDLTNISYLTRADSSRILFQSDITGDFNIYSSNETFNFQKHAQNNMKLTVEENKLDAINSPYQDKCPTLINTNNNKHLIFSSNRPGGYGGYDLYFSYLKSNGEWSKPINFGNEINSAFDDYRPVIQKTNDYSVLLFSSNRPGGMGGFDLYISRIDFILFLLVIEQEG